MSIYEFTFIVQQGLTHYEIEGLIASLSGLLSKSGASVIKYEYWGLRDLSYPINKMNKAHYCMMYVDSTPQILDKFQSKIKLNEDIMRFLFLKRKKVADESSSMIKEN